MTDEHDFAIDAVDLGSAEGLAADEAPSGVADPVPAPPPMVLIQYQSRGLHATLLPPLLILLSALAIASYQRQARLRPVAPLAPTPKTLEVVATEASPVGEGRTIVVDPSATGSVDGPIAVHAASEPSPLVPVPVRGSEPATAPDLPAPAEGEPTRAIARAEKPAEPDLFSPFALEARPAISPPTDGSGREDRDEPPLEPPAPLTSTRGEVFSPDSPEWAFHAAAEPAAVGLLPDPSRIVANPLTKEQVLQGIEEEAGLKMAEQKALEREVANSHIRGILEAMKKAQEERPLFHADLRRVLRELGDGAGAEINAICNRYGRVAHPDIHKGVVLMLNRSAARLKQEAKVDLMRSRGVPEPVILEYLAKGIHQTINTRGGPRDENEVRVRAAQLLLKYPLLTAETAGRARAATGKAPASDRNPAAARSVAGVAAPPVPRAARPPQ